MSVDKWIHCQAWPVHQVDHMQIMPICGPHLTVQNQQAAARDASMLLGMRRRLQAGRFGAGRVGVPLHYEDVLTRRLAKIGVQQAADTEAAVRRIWSWSYCIMCQVVNVMTQMLVLDVELWP